jgi:hypothetical protein
MYLLVHHVFQYSSNKDGRCKSMGCLFMWFGWERLDSLIPRGWLICSVGDCKTVCNICQLPCWKLQPSHCSFVLQYLPISHLHIHHNTKIFQQTIFKLRRVL